MASGLRIPASTIAQAGRYDSAESRSDHFVQPGELQYFRAGRLEYDGGGTKDRRVSMPFVYRERVFPGTLVCGFVAAVRDPELCGDRRDDHRQFVEKPRRVDLCPINDQVQRLTDGTSSTVLVAETREQNAAVWIDGGTASLTSRRYDDSNPPSYAAADIAINYTPFYNSAGQGIDCLWAASSLHTGGAHHLFGDGSVHFLSQNISVNVYDALVTRAGAETISGGSY